MKIGIFTNCYHPMVNGIVGTISILKKGLMEQGHQVYIFAPKYDDYRDQEEQVYRFPAMDLTWRIKYPIANTWFPKLNRFINNLDLDIVHCHHPFILGRLGVKVARRKKIPVVYTFHTQYDQHSHYVPLPQWGVKFFIKLLVYQFSVTVDGITIPAESARETLRAYGIKNQVHVIPNPIDLSQFHNQDGDIIRKKYGLKGEKVLISIGRVAPEKNLPFLLEVYQYIQTQTASDSTRFMIVGAGSELDKLKDQAEKLGIAPRVIFTGLVEPVEIPKFLAAADLFVMASNSEVKPLAQLEAMAAGVPIVAVSAPGAVDTIIHGENGFLVREDVSEFGQAALEIFSNSEKQLSYQKAALKTAASYSYLKIAHDYVALYADLIEKNSKSHSGKRFLTQN
jgi:1,2-diacylglycerol 3-alpha-glucosyltransferase